MNRDDLAGFVEAALLTLGLYTLFGYLLFVLNTYPPGFILLVLGFSVVATVLLSSLLLPRFSLATSSAKPEQALAHIAYGLRRRGFRVEETSDYATVRIGSTAAVRIHVRPSLSGSRLSYQAFATPAGWGTLITLIVIVWGAPAGIGAVLYVFQKARRFARDVAVPLVHEAESMAPLHAADEIQSLLVSGLSEGHRLAAEAYEALRSAYMDSLALMGVTAFLAWAIAFAGLAFATYLLPLPGGWILAMAIAAAVGIVTASVSVALLRRRMLPQLVRSRSWSDRMREALTREAARAPPLSAEPSAVELLLDASKEIPSWLESRRRAGLSADQAADWVVFILSVASFWAIFYGTDQFLLGAPLGGVLELLAGVGLGCGAYALWVHWKRKRDEAIARTREEWHRRIDVLQSRLDQFLQDL